MRVVATGMPREVPEPGGSVSPWVGLLLCLSAAMEIRIGKIRAKAGHRRRLPAWRPAHQYGRTRVWGGVLPAWRPEHSTGRHTVRRRYGAVNCTQAGVARSSSVPSGRRTMKKAGSPARWPGHNRRPGREPSAPSRWRPPRTHSGIDDTGGGERMRHRPAGTGGQRVRDTLSVEQVGVAVVARRGEGLSAEHHGYGRRRGRRRMGVRCRRATSRRARCGRRRALRRPLPRDGCGIPHAPTAPPPDRPRSPSQGLRGQPIPSARAS